MSLPIEDTQVTSDTCKCGWESMTLPGYTGRVKIVVDIAERWHTRERCDTETVHTEDCWKWHHGCSVKMLEQVLALCDTRDAETAGFMMPSSLTTQEIREAMKGECDE